MRIGHSLTVQRRMTPPHEETRTVKFGLMTQIQMPRPWGPNPEVQAYANAIAQAEAADALGFDTFWITEQHFFLEIGHSACPDMLLAAISQRTKRIRLGFSVVLMTINNPFAIAERVATLDALSNGRVDFGMGRGSTPYMVDAFGVDRAGERERLRRGDRRGDADVPRGSVHRFQGQVSSTCRSATCCRASCRSRIRRYGSRPPTCTQL